MMVLKAIGKYLVALLSFFVAAIRKAIWTIDFSLLLPACNPNWLEFTKNNSYDWKTLKDSASNPQVKKAIANKFTGGV